MELLFQNIGFYISFYLSFVIYLFIYFYLCVGVVFPLAFFFFFCYKGFSLGSTVQSETKGIWAWCKPHPTQTEQVLLLLDTEGLGDVAKV
jgi:hypothetical protein